MFSFQKRLTKNHAMKSKPIEIVNHKRVDINLFSHIKILFQMSQKVIFTFNLLSLKKVKIYMKDYALLLLISTNCSFSPLYFDELTLLPFRIFYVQAELSVNFCVNFSPIFAKL